MLTRDWSARPEPYNGVQMRSKLERHVAEFLDELGVGWEYEIPVVHDGRILRYLPDFKIAAPRGDLRLDTPDRPTIPQASHWIEVKPQEFIYALRDHLGVPERTSEPVVIPIGAVDLKDAGIEELWKPKALAEIVTRQVLVVGAVNRDRTLSVRMNAYGVVFETDHPLVNYRGVLRAQEKARQRERWQREAAERQAQYETQQRQRNAERLEVFGQIVRHSHRIVSRYDGSCEWCHKRFEAFDLYAYKATRWVAICRPCSRLIESST